MTARCMSTTAIFESAESDEQFAPFGKKGFAGEEFAEDDSIAAQQHPARGLDCAWALDGDVGVKQSPAAGTMARTRAASTSLPGATLGIDQRTQIVETISGH